MIIAIRAVGPTVDVLRRHYGVDHLHESGWSMDFSSNSCLFHGIIRYGVVEAGDARVIFNIRTFGRIVWIEGLPLKCKGTREYVRKPPSIPLARETAGVRECGAIYGVSCLGKFTQTEMRHGYL